MGIPFRPKSSTPPKAINVLEYLEPQFLANEAAQEAADGAVGAIYRKIDDLRAGEKMRLMNERRAHQMSPQGDADSIARLTTEITRVETKKVAALNAEIDETRARSGGGPTRDMVLAKGKALGGNFQGFAWEHDESKVWGAEAEARFNEIKDSDLKAIDADIKRTAERTVAPFSDDDLDALVKKIAKPAASFDPTRHILNPKRPGGFRAQVVDTPERIPSFGVVRGFVDPWALLAYSNPEFVKAHLAEKIKATSGSRPVMSRSEQLEKLRELHEKKLVLQHEAESLVRAAKRAGVYLKRPPMDLQARMGFRWKTKPRLRDLDPELGFSISD
ncbi:MAG TPA: hypothetical protein VNQ34_11635 [Xanthobacteraceae bacterium]|nr:hypothetical protein [Xanthobacteraceae bacterium]